MFILQRTYVHPPTPAQAFANAYAGIRQCPYRHLSTPVQAFADARRVMPLIGAFYGIGKRRLLPSFDPCRGLAAAEMPSSTELLSQQGHYDEGYG